MPNNFSPFSVGPWQRKSIPGHLFELTDVEGNPILRIRGGLMPTLSDAKLLEGAAELFSALRDLVERIDTDVDFDTEEARDLLARISR